MPSPSIKWSQDKFLVSGDIIFPTATQILNESREAFSRRSEWVCDLSGITACDSAGLAVLIEWKKWAKQQNKRIQLLNIPAVMQSIASAAGLTI